MAFNTRFAGVTDVDAIRQLFYNTVTTINCRHYNAEQITAWAAGYNNRESWANKVAIQNFIVAEQATELVGFSSLTNEGYLDFMFVHHQWQSQGIASLLLTEIEKIACKRQLTVLTTHASITAKPFFVKKGFTLIQQQTVQRRGATLTNFIMGKDLSPGLA